jgi:hypothetical protein
MRSVVDRNVVMRCITLYIVHLLDKYDKILMIQIVLFHYLV